MSASEGIDIPACDDCTVDITEAQCIASQRRAGGIWCADCERKHSPTRAVPRSTRRTDMSQIMLTVTETVEYRAEVKVTDDLLDEAARFGLPRTPAGVLEMLENSDGEHDVVAEIVDNDNAWAVYARYASGRVA